MAVKSVLRKERMRMNTLLFVLIGVIIGFAGDYYGLEYYKKRFNKKWNVKKSYIPAMLLCGLGGGIFYIYGYRAFTIILYIVLFSALLVIGHIDKEQMIIPDAIIRTLFSIRIITLAIEMLLDKDNAFWILGSAVMGLIYGTVIFLIVRIFAREGIGLGDVKLFAVIGFFVGNKTILWLMLSSFLIAMVSGLIKVAKKELSMKDAVSFGPYITAGSILIMLLGV